MLNANNANVGSSSRQINKLEEYSKLVVSRKKCRLCLGLSNPSCSQLAKYDSNHIGPWSQWQGNIDSDILLVGQDWGDISYYTKWEGMDQPSGNPTNENLQQLLYSIGIKIGKPQERQEQVLFFTNLILCLKQGGLQSQIRKEWLINCSRHFFYPLVEIIDPKIIIALGRNVFESILELYGSPNNKHERFSDIVEHGPVKLNKSLFLFPVYHCGARGVNINRPITIQREDWSKITKWL